MKNKDYLVNYNLPKNIPEIWNLEENSIRELYSLFKYYNSKTLELLLKFYYKYTQLKYNKLIYFTDNNIIEFSKDLALLLIDSQYIGSSYFSEDGLYIDSCFGIIDDNDFNKDIRYDFIFFLLKCKYTSSKCNSILDYYINLTELNKYKLIQLLHLDNKSTWKEIVNKMEYNKNGRVNYTFNFINNVLI